MLMGSDIRVNMQQSYEVPVRVFTGNGNEMYDKINIRLHEGTSKTTEADDHALGSE